MRLLLVATALAALTLAAAHSDHEHDHHEHNDHDHDHGGHDHGGHEHGGHDHGGHDHGGHEHGHDHGHDDHLHEHHDILELSAKQYEKMVAADDHVWAVKFHSEMCGSCQSFKPTFEAGAEAVDGLHWAAINIDIKENIGLAKRMGVLTEGIPNVKLVNAADSPLSIVGGELPTAAEFTDKVRDVLVQAGASKDAGGYYQARGRQEL
jgi:thiol-disulfide isomerase/thioredoxin